MFWLSPLLDASWDKVLSCRLFRRSSLSFLQGTLIARSGCCKVGIIISFVMRLKSKYLKQLAIGVCSVCICATEEIYAVPVLWGVDEDTGHLLKVVSYNSSPTLTDYGLLSLNDGGTIRELYDTSTSNSAVFSDIEAFTISPSGTAYMVANSTYSWNGIGGGTYVGSHLYSLEIYDPTTGAEKVSVDDSTASNGYNAIQSVGTLTTGDEPVNGIDFDPISGLLFGVIENGGRDDLITIKPETAVVNTITTSMSGTDDVEDIQFESTGTLYLIDDDGGESETDDVLHTVTLNRNGGSVTFENIAVDVNNTGGDTEIEGLAWDLSTGTLVGFSDDANTLIALNTSSNGYTTLGAIGFNDVEGIDFVPTISGLPQGVPDTGSTAALFGLGVAALAFARCRLG